MRAVNINHFSSGPAPKEWADIPEIKAAKPINARFVEISLQQLTGFPKSVMLAQWMGAKNGLWYPASDVFRISKSGKTF